MDFRGYYLRADACDYCRSHGRFIFTHILNQRLHGHLQFCNTVFHFFHFLTSLSCFAFHAPL
nr:MAG TPA: hypothetical protein [Caudoviricetes sp.]